jgi:uncharacterized protein with PIN domain
VDQQVRELREELTGILRKAAEVKVALDRANGTIRGVPHYTLIEEAAEEVGREVSRLVQERHMAELATEHLAAAKCPECGTRCETKVERRRRTSVAGPVELPEPTAYCPRCRRAFFPSPRDVGL